MVQGTGAAAAEQGERGLKSEGTLNLGFLTKKIRISHSAIMKLMACSAVTKWDWVLEQQQQQLLLLNKARTGRAYGD